MIHKCLSKFNAIILFLSFAASVFGQNQTAKLPATTLGVIVREWLAVVEAGKPAEIERFVETRFSSAAKRNQPNAVQFFRKLHEQSGGLELIKITPPAGEYPMSIIARSKRGGHFARITVGTDSAEKEKLAGLGVDRAEDPAAPKLSQTDQKFSDKQMIAAIRAEIERRAARGEFSGVVLVAKDDRILIETAYGFADVENKIPNGKETKFHLASVGKMFTAVAIAQLVEAGKLSYDDTVAKLLPDFPNREIAEKITVHQLLTHTAGMGTFFWSPGYDKDRVFRTATEEIVVYKDEKLVFEPGARWRYSNAGYSLLGAIIERVSGKTYLEYLRENIFKPLKMRDTYTNAPGEIERNAAVLYIQSPDDPLGIEPFAADRKIQSSHASGLGGGSATARDLLKFARAYRKGTLLGADVIEKIAAGKVADDDKGASRWGYGIRERTINHALVRGHSGGGRTDLQMLWASGYTVIVQTNKTPPSATALSGEIIAFLTKQLAMRNKS